MGLLNRILHKGRLAEPNLAFDTATAKSSTNFGGSLQLRHVDAGSCNGCELEISGCFSPVYDAERYGIRLVASPRHADGLIVTGVVTRNMQGPLSAAWTAMAKPSVVVAIGDCACDGGVLKDGYGVVGPVSEILPVDAGVKGCPPRPEQILAILRQFSNR